MTHKLRQHVQMVTKRKLNLTSLSAVQHLNAFVTSAGLEIYPECGWIIH